MKKNIRPLILFFSLIFLFFNCNGSSHTMKLRPKINSTIPNPTSIIETDGYDSDFSIFSSLSTQSKKSQQFDTEFKSMIKKHITLPIIQTRDLCKEFEAELVPKTKKRKRLAQAQESQEISLSLSETTWELLIKEGRNKDLQKYLYAISSIQQAHILKNKLGQNPAHIAALTCGAEYSLGVVTRIFPNFVFNRDDAGKLPEDYVICPSSKKTTTKLDLINSAKSISNR
jgi:hypothetical protein